MYISYSLKGKFYLHWYYNTTFVDNCSSVFINFITIHYHQQALAELTVTRLLTAFYQITFWFLILLTSGFMSNGFFNIKGGRWMLLRFNLKFLFYCIQRSRKLKQNQSIQIFSRQTWIWLSQFQFKKWLIAKWDKHGACLCWRLTPLNL